MIWINNEWFLQVFVMLLFSRQSFSGDLSISLSDQTNHLTIIKKINGKSQIVSIDKHVASRKIQELRILAQPGNTKFQYAVIQVNGYLYGEAQGRGYCGAGEEENTLWLKFDEKLNIIDAQSYLTTSCKESIGSTTLIRHDADLLEIEVEYSKAGEDNKNRLKLSPDGANANAVKSQAWTDLGRAATFYDCLVEVAAATVTA